ncbi:MAG: DUF3362 domain-containing protein, partial [Shewanella sp.]
AICGHLGTDHKHTIDLYRAARALPGIKKILIASGVRYDLAIEDPAYVKELVQHHVGGYLKIAPEHTETGPLSKMMKPGMGTYDRFKALFDQYSKEAGKEQFLIPYFISAHPGTTDEDMLNLALWLKERKFKLDQVQNFYPSPMANATTMYHTELNSLKNIKHTSEVVPVPKKGRQRRLHKALLRYHDPAGWPLIREGLIAMGREDLIGNSPHQLVPAEGRNERGPKWMKDPSQGQKAVTRFAANQFDARKGEPGKGAGKGLGKDTVKGQGKDASKGRSNHAHPAKPNGNGAHPAKPDQFNGPKVSRPGAKAPFGQSGFKGVGQGGQNAKGGKVSKGSQGGAPAKGKKPAKTAG